MAASPREIEDVRKDPDKWRPLILQLLKFDRPALTDDFLDFAERVLALSWLQEISYRQTEWLLGVRDNVRFVSTYRQFSLKALLKLCYENRLDFDDEEAEAWLEAMYLSGATEFRLYEAKRIYAFARRLDAGDYEEDAA